MVERVRVTAAASYAGDALSTGVMCLERAMGIEPTFIAWEAIVLPLDDARASRRIATSQAASS